MQICCPPLVVRHLDGSHLNVVDDCACSRSRARGDDDDMWNWNVCCGLSPKAVSQSCAPLWALFNTVQSAGNTEDQERLLPSSSEADFLGWLCVCLDRENMEAAHNGRHSRCGSMESTRCEADFALRKGVGAHCASLEPPAAAANCLSRDVPRSDRATRPTIPKNHRLRVLPTDARPKQAQRTFFYLNDPSHPH